METLYDLFCASTGNLGTVAAQSTTEVTEVKQILLNEESEDRLDRISSYDKSKLYSNSLETLLSKCKKIKQFVREKDTRNVFRIFQEDHYGNLFPFLFRNTVETNENIRVKCKESYQYVPSDFGNIEEAFNFFNLKDSNKTVYDIGSGLGRPTILFALLSNAKVKGVEYQESYVQKCREIAAKHKIHNLEYIHADAREVDYSDGDCFYMYTPFTGELLQEVLDKLKEVARKKEIQIYFHGPSLQLVQVQEWLRTNDVGALHNRHGFISLPESNWKSPLILKEKCDHCGHETDMDSLIENYSLRK